jgi:predicted nucleic acid-binding protein
LRVVVDASVAVKWYTPEVDHEKAKTLLNLVDACVAPELIVTEVINVAWSKARRGEISVHVARMMTESISSGTPRLRPAADSSTRALDMGLALGHPVYDCFYLACAEAEGLPLITADRRFLRALEGSAWAALAMPLADAADHLAGARH